MESFSSVRSLLHSSQICSSHRQTRTLANTPLTAATGAICGWAILGLMALPAPRAIAMGPIAQEAPVEAPSGNALPKPELEPEQGANLGTNADIDANIKAEPVEAPSPLERELELDIPNPSQNGVTDGIDTPAKLGEEAAEKAAEEAIEGAAEEVLEETLIEVDPTGTETNADDGGSDLQENDSQSSESPDDDSAETADESADSERVYLAERQISFVPPEGFTAMSSEEINLKFPGSMPPQFAYGNDRRSVSIGVSLSDIDLAPEQLPEVRQFLESFLEDAVPGFEWVARDYENMGGARWIKLEFISQALDTQVHNDLYLTSFNGKLLGFNFNSVLSLERRLRPQLEDSRESITLDPVTARRDRRR